MQFRKPEVIFIQDGRSAGARFSTRLISNTVCLFHKFFNELSWPAFWYREQQTNSFFTIALSKMTNGLLLQECPVDRVFSRESKFSYKKGRSDYWCKHAGNGFFVECKHFWQERKAPNPGVKKLLDHHLTGVAQIKKISPEARSRWAVNTGVAITAAPFYTKLPALRLKSNDHESITAKELLRNIKDKFPSYVKNLGALAWLPLSKKYRPAEKWPNMSYQEWYPGVAFLATWQSFRNR